MTRSNARELAAHLIYELDYTDETPEQAIESRMERGYYDALAGENEVYAERPSKKQMAYITACVAGVASHAEELDALIASHAIDWSIDRIARVDLCILRVALYEMLYRSDVPSGAAINEAVELAKRFGGEKSYAFINGILGVVARELEKPGTTTE